MPRGVYERKKKAPQEEPVATQEGVTAEVSAEPPSDIPKREKELEKTDTELHELRKSDPRKGMMDMLVARHEGEMEQQLVPEPVEEEEAVEEEQEEAPVYTGPTVLIELSDGSKVEVPESSIKTRIKVDGQEEDLDLSTIKRGYQKEAAASKRFEEASRLKQQAEELLKQTRQPSKDAGRNAPPVEDAQLEERIDELYREYHDLLFEDSEKATRKLREIRTAERSRVNSQIDEDMVAARVLQKVSGRQAGDWFKETYKDIFEDPNLFAIADREVDAIFEKDPSRNLQDVFKEAGDNVRAWVKKFQPEEKTPVKAIDKKRELKKETVDHIPASAIKATLGEDEAPPPTNSDVIRDMAKRSNRSYSVAGRVAK